MLENVKIMTHTQMQAHTDRRTDGQTSSQKQEWEISKWSFVSNFTFKFRLHYAIYRHILPPVLPIYLGFIHFGLQKQQKQQQQEICSLALATPSESDVFCPVKMTVEKKKVSKEEIKYETKMKWNAIVDGFLCMFLILCCFLFNCTLITDVILLENDFTSKIRENRPFFCFQSKYFSDDECIAMNNCLHPFKSSVIYHLLQVLNHII